MSESQSTITEHYSRKIRNGAWLDAQVFPPLAWAVPGLVPEGFGLLIGPPKAGKSWAALSIALSLSLGGVAFGNVPVGTPRRVLYLALEDGDRRLQERCRSLLLDEPIPAWLDFTTRATPVEAVEMIRWWLGEHGHGRPLVLLDTLGKVSPPAAPGESAYGRDYRIGGTLKQLADDWPGSTVLAVHHDRKASAEDFVDSVSGTHGLAGASDFVIVLDRKRHEDDAILKVTGRDVREAEYAVTLSSTGQWTLKGEDLADAARAASTVKSTAGLGDRSAEIVEWVVSQTRPVSPTEVANALGIPDARRYLTRLVEQDRLYRAARGSYTSVPTVPVSQEGEALWDSGTDGTRNDQGDAA